MSHDMKNCPLSSIDSAIKSINNIKNYIDETVEYLKTKTQEEVDEYIINVVNPQINNMLSTMRQDLIDTIKKQYDCFTQKSSDINAIQQSSLSADLTKIFNFCVLVKDFLIKAYNDLIEFQTLLISHLSDLTSSITGLISYRPMISGINLDKLDIHCEPITLSDITGE